MTCATCMLYYHKECGEMFVQGEVHCQCSRLSSPLFKGALCIVMSGIERVLHS